MARGQVCSIRQSVDSRPVGLYLLLDFQGLHLVSVLYTPPRPAHAPRAREDPSEERDEGRLGKSLLPPLVGNATLGGRASPTPPSSAGSRSCRPTTCCLAIISASPVTALSCVRTATALRSCPFYSVVVTQLQYVHGTCQG